MSLTRIFKRHPSDDLSAFIDGVLPDDRHTRVAGHVASCATCSVEIESLRAVSDALRDLPPAAAPRSFVLTPETAASRPRPHPSHGPSAGLLNALRVSGAAVAVALAVVLVIDLGGDSGTTTDDSMKSEASPVFDSSIQSSDTSRGEDAYDGAGVGGPQEEAAAAPGATGTPSPTDADLQDAAPLPGAGSVEESVPSGDSVTDSDDSDGNSAFRLLEVALAVALAAIVVAGILIKRTRPRRADL